MARDLSGLTGEVVVAPDATSAGEALTEWLLPIIAARVAASGRLTIAVSGGNSPIALYESWCDAATAAVLHLAAWEVFAVDDRAVPADHPKSNARLVVEHLLNPAGTAAPTFHPMDGGAADLAEAAAAYAALLDERLDHDEHGTPVFDVVLLGLGDDGHTASLFPGQAALDVIDRSVIHAFANVEPTDRLTLTFPVLNAARHLAVFAPGASKADALQETATGSTPAARLRAVDQRWFVEVAAVR